jgi:hypothetical protein
VDQLLGSGLARALVFLMVHPRLFLIIALELGFAVFFGIRGFGDLVLFFEQVSNPVM